MTLLQLCQSPDKQVYSMKESLRNFNLINLYVNFIYIYNVWYWENENIHQALNLQALVQRAFLHTVRNIYRFLRLLYV